MSNNIPESEEFPWVRTSPLRGKTSYMITDKVIKIMIDNISTVIAESLSRFNEEGFRFTKEEVGKAVIEFNEVYEQRPVKDNSGGTGYGNLLLLYVIARIYNPDLIIESGVWKGLSLWVLHKACPSAEIHGFDISFSRLEEKISSVAYHEHDWSSFEFGNVSERKALVHFDDHINHSKRIMEAHGKNFRHLLLDDNLPVYYVYTEGKPLIVPTLDMIFDSNIVAGDEIKWFNGSEVVSAEVTKESLQAGTLVENWTNLPDINPGKARFNNTGKLAYARLKRS